MPDTAGETRANSLVTSFYEPLHGRLPPISQTIKDEQNMPDTAWETRTNSLVTSFYGPLHGHLPPISQTIKVTRTRHAGHCWKHTSVGQTAKTCVQQLSEEIWRFEEKIMNVWGNRQKKVECLFGVYSISTPVGYLMLNPLYKYIEYIWFVNSFCR